ncbi:FAD:protein FMN transferase [Romboutsia sp.]|uniref:FAD:protein FMN transferase n=1 Tax=Romboutsia sp. TaxID=1965302 RepID=UPI003F36C180
MKDKKVIFIFVAIILGVVGIYTYNINNKLKSFNKDYFALGTVNEITIFSKDEEKSNKVLNQCGNILNDITNRMSTHISTSEINQINQSAGKDFVKVSPDTFELIKTAIKYGAISKGTFDITIGPVVDLWAIGTDKARVPSSLEIKNILPLVNYKNILLDEKNLSIKLANPNMEIDLGGIAKGFAADKIASYLRSQEVDNAIINLGGNIYVLGNKEDKTPFNIGIQDPTQPRGNAIGSIEASNVSVVTSGIYERYIEKNNKIYHHMINPSTGYPFDNNLSSVTIISTISMNCDALSTSAFGLGLDKGLELVNNLDNVDAIFITRDKKIYLTKGIKDNFVLNDTSFTIINK